MKLNLLSFGFIILILANISFFIQTFHHIWFKTFRVLPEVRLANFILHFRNAYFFAAKYFFNHFFIFYSHFIQEYFSSCFFFFFFQVNWLRFFINIILYLLWRLIIQRTKKIIYFFMLIDGFIILLNHLFSKRILLNFRNNFY